ncbi:molybdenum ABC transporter permease subunit [Anoxybacter fermentans]|uniref:Molybdenum transport system permease n=1 Tax=Anoxybacter fermentans TaxID=1323375 RepID=A0A3S9SUY6_9FIRM|nr:molybdate ABC transporter permease subunit [Anoxybacter fermentans]AZR72111.1 molybdenum ABC transporter permease subunit [Anoxybacter fermentans]
MNQIWFSIYLSFKIAFISTLLVIFIGFWVSWILVRKDFMGKKLIEVLVNLPLLVPPSVLGYYLLLIFGREGLIGYGLEKYLGIRLVFHWTGGIVAAVMVSLPLYINAVRPALATLEQEVEQAAKVDGATDFQVFYKIILPLISKSLIAGIALTFARSLGEFGATLMLIGNIPGKTQTMSLAIYQAVLSGEYGIANQLVFILTFFAILIMLFIGKIDTKFE